MGRRFWQNNEGFNLIEVIVAIIITGIIAAGASIGVSTVFNARVDSAAEVFGNFMKETRKKAMALDNTEDSSSGESDVFVVFYKKGDNYYAEMYQIAYLYDYTKKPSESGYKSFKAIEKLGSTKTLCNDYVEIVLSNHEGTDTFTVGELNTANGLAVFFKHNGAISAIKTCLSNSGDISDGTAVFANYVCPANGHYADTVNFNKNTENVTVIIVNETGRCYLDE